MLPSPRSANPLFSLKPTARGWIHTISCPVALALGLVLVIMAPTVNARIACAIFTMTAGLLFGISAIYHRGRFTPQATAILKRADHANIFLIIAGTFTPLAVITLPYDEARNMLLLGWIGAIVGVAFRLLWLSAPRWLYVPAYVALGVAALVFTPDILQFRTGGVVMLLLAIGGAMYIIGAIIYGFKWPSPRAKHFGFHEYFHVCTVLGFGCHLASVACAVAGLYP
ncbi:hemolysin III family protein [Micrococcales bacterium 31B]|nr:hemolysin III family protein [Micrococcales bacterium 31B]